MTLVLGKRGDKEPFQCGVCGRAATSIGYMPNDRQPILWLCDEGSCISQAKWVYHMKPKDLNYWEGRAVEHAAQVVSESIVEATLNILWERKLENLNQIDAEQFTEITKSATENQTYKKALTDFLLNFSTGLRTELESRDPPF